jgi:hypothetical protein
MSDGISGLALEEPICAGEVQQADNEEKKNSI